MNYIVNIDEEKCIRCGLCIKDCPQGIIELTATGVAPKTNECIKCGHCVAVCPKAAVLITDFEDMPEDIANYNLISGDDMVNHIKARRSMRHFTSQKIDAQIVAQILEAGRYTPSGSNKQEVSYVVIEKNIAQYEALAVNVFRRTKKVLDLFSSKFRRYNIDANFFFKNAPVVIFIKSTDTVDGALAASSMELTAQGYGLGVLYSGFFTVAVKLSPKLKKHLGVKRGEKAITTLVLGYPAIRYQRTAPKKRPDIHYD